MACVFIKVVPFLRQFHNGHGFDGIAWDDHGYPALFTEQPSEEPLPYRYTPAAHKAHFGRIAGYADRQLVLHGHFTLSEGWLFVPS